MPDTLVSLRKAKGLTQEQLGQELARRLKRRIGTSYAQKKIARFEVGAAAPTDAEVEVLAKILRVRPGLLRRIAERAPQQAVQIVGDLAATGRSLIATCMMARPRPEPIDESYEGYRLALENKNFWVALFLPYPTGVNLPEMAFPHVNNLVGYYTRVVKDVLAANLAFINTLTKRTDAIAVYVPKAELLKASALLIPPIFRQFSLTVRQPDPPKGPITKSLAVWTPGKDVDTARPLKAIGTYSLHDQIDAWESYFGDIVPYWIRHSKLPGVDDYWEKLR